MNPKYISILAGIILSACESTTPEQSGNNTPEEEPESGNSSKNVVFIIVDDLSDALGCYGNTMVQSPNIDALAEKGVRFTDAHANHSVSGPSRTSMLTGLTTYTTEIFVNDKDPDATGDMATLDPTESIELYGWITLPYFFKQNGYHTVNIEKVFHSPDTQETHGDAKAWSEYHLYENDSSLSSIGYNNLTNDYLSWCRWRMVPDDDSLLEDGQSADKAVAIIKQERTKPLFLAVGLHKPHSPYNAPEKYFNMYNWSDCLPVAPDEYDPPHATTFYQNYYNGMYDMSDDNKRNYLRAYYACISYMDVQVGKIIDAIEESGKMDDTIIVFISDHGYHLGEHKYYWSKVTLMNRATRVPMIIAGGAVKEENRGESSDAIVQLVDLYPTLVELAGLSDAPAILEGKSIAHLLDDPSGSHRKYAITSVDRVSNSSIVQVKNRHGLSAKSKEWSYSHWPDTDAGAQRLELYNRINDPMEYTNLAEDSQYEDTIAEMQAALDYYPLFN